jgi:hypothetical protein
MSIDDMEMIQWKLGERPFLNGIYLIQKRAGIHFQMEDCPFFLECRNSFGTVHSQKEPVQLKYGQRYSGEMDTTSIFEWENIFQMRGGFLVGQHCTLPAFVPAG